MKSSFEIAPLSVSEAEFAPFAAGSNLSFRIFAALPKGKATAARVLRRNLLRKARGTVTTSTGTYVAIDAENIDFGAELIKRNGTWEEHVTQACLKFLRPGDVFYDIGANSGYVSLEVARRFGKAVSVCAFEPQPGLAKKLAISSRLNDFSNINVYQVMLGAREEDALLYLAENSMQASAVARSSAARSIHCRAATVDTVLDRGFPPPNVIKIDVEGAELDVFGGSERTLAQYQPIIVFEVDANMDRFHYTRDDLLGLLARHVPYAFYFLDPSKGLIGMAADPDNGSSNMVAIPVGHPRSVLKEKMW